MTDPNKDLPDPDATILVPTPGRSRGAAPPPPPPSPAPSLDSGFLAPSREPAAPVDLSVVSGMNIVVAAANPLLTMVPRIRGSVSHPDPDGLRESLLRQLATFEQQARGKGATPEVIVVARYALCTLIDEAVSSTPWGGTAQWATKSLLVTLHRETWGGEKFFQLLNKMAEDPGRNIDLLELLYVCLALGFEGRFRVIDGGRAQLEALRERLAQIIRQQRGEYERDLSGNWRGEQTQIRKVSSLLPLWVTACVVALVLLGTYLFFSFSLNEGSDGIAFAKLRAPAYVPPVKVTAAPPKPVPPRFSKFLAEEIKQGLVTVRDEANQSLVSIRGDGLFASGSVQVKDEYVPILMRIADALNDVRGPVTVIGHTDSVPTRTIRFPSNWHLSKERAESVVKLISPKLTDPKRIAAEGRGDTEPVAANDTPANRALNRRVEVLVTVIGS